MYIFLDDLGIVFAVIWIRFYDLWFLDKKFIVADFSEIAAAKRDDRVTELHKTVAHSSLELVHIDDTAGKVCIWLLEQD